MEISLEKLDADIGGQRDKVRRHSTMNTTVIQ